MPIQNERKTVLISIAFAISEKNIISGYCITREGADTENALLNEGIHSNEQKKAPSPL